jgi:hypothetical protein
MLRHIKRLGSIATQRRLYANAVIGIRREDKNCWERRVPLTPKHVRELVSSRIEKKLTFASDLQR